MSSIFSSMSKSDQPAFCYFNVEAALKNLALGRRRFRGSSFREPYCISLRSSMVLVWLSTKSLRTASATACVNETG